MFAPFLTGFLPCSSQARRSVLGVNDFYTRCTLSHDWTPGNMRNCACGRNTSTRPVTEHALRVLGTASCSILSKINKIFPNMRFSLSICSIFFYNVLAMAVNHYLEKEKKKSRPSPVPLPGFEPRPAAKSYLDTTNVQYILPTALMVLLTHPKNILLSISKSTPPTSKRRLAPPSEASKSAPRASASPRLCQP